MIGVGQSAELEIRVAENAAEAVIDRIQFQQVLLSLMRNAVEAMADSARRDLVIITARPNDMVAISVTDTGPGLPEQVRARLFQRFVPSKPNGMGWDCQCVTPSSRRTGANFSLKTETVVGRSSGLLSQVRGSRSKRGILECSGRSRSRGCNR